MKRIRGFMPLAGLAVSACFLGFYQNCSAPLDAGSEPSASAAASTANTTSGTSSIIDTSSNLVYIPPASGSSTVVSSFYHVYEAGSQMQHHIGRADGKGWSANTVDDRAGYLIFGPYATDWGNGPAQALFRLMVDNNTADNLDVITIDVNDATAGQVLASRTIKRQELPPAYIPGEFVLNFSMAGREGHKMEARVYFHGVSYVKVNFMAVSSMLASYSARDQLYHRIGRAEGDGWAADTIKDAGGGLLLSGPSATGLPSGQRRAIFRLMVDNNTADNLELFLLDIYDATTGTVIAQKSLRRQELGPPGAYFGFALDFALTAEQSSHQIETRVYSYGRTYVRADYVTIQ